MKQCFWIGVILVVAGSLILAACSSTAQSMGGEQASPGEPADNRAEHRMDHDSDEALAADLKHMHVNTPGQYADLTNPLAGDAVAIAAGQAIFSAN